MNKSRFIELLRDPQRIQARDLEELRDLGRDNPYCQLLHILAAKGSHSLGSDSFSQNLSRAATYSRDRMILKRTIEGMELPIPTVAAIEESEPTLEESNFDWIEPDSEIEAELATDTEDELDTDAEIENENETEAGQVSDQSTESPEDEQETEEPPWFEDFQEQSDTPSVESVDDTTAPEEEINLQQADDQAPEIIVPSDEVDLSNVSDAPLDAPEITGSPTEDHTPPAEDATTSEEADSINEDLLDLEINAQAQAASIHDELQNNLSKLRQSREEYEQPDEDTVSTDDLNVKESAASDTSDVSSEADEMASDQELSEVQLESSSVTTDHAEVEADSDENQTDESEQDPIEIIDTFIKNSPVLSKPDLSADSEATSQKDLSKKSGIFNDDLVSEQLAKILVKQGRRKDAEKIYKKLIVKFPKKKSYFADQIKNISKK